LIDILKLSQSEVPRWFWT